MLGITFLSPMWLHLAIALPLLWVMPRPVRDRVHGALRILVMLFLIFAIAQPVSFETSDEAWHVVVLDGSSAAVEADTGPSIAGSIGRAVDAPDRAILVRGPRAPEGEALDGVFDRIVRVTDERSTVPLGAMLAAAGRAIPEGARGSITLISDGLATDRRWGPAVQDLQVRGIPVHTVLLASASGILALRGVDLPEIARVGHVARIGVRAEVPASGAVAQLVDAEGRELARTTIPAGSERGVLAFEPEHAGVLEAELRLLGAGGAYVPVEANHRAVRLAVQEPLRVAYVGERMVEGGPQLGALLGAGFEIASSAPPVPLRNVLLRSDVLVIDDAAAERIPEDVQKEILQSVERDRLGLVMTGGRGAFGAGGWHGQPLTEALPIEMVQKEEKRDPSTTLVVIIDTSGSMGGNRVQLAKEVARLAIRRLLPHDKVGIVEFYGAKRWAAPIQPASNAIEIQRALNRLNAGGGTVIMPAIEEAFYGLQNVRTRYKHVLVLTDGGVEQGAFEPLLRRMADKGITVSTVLVGPGMHSEFLVNLANWGKGRFYGVPNRFNLPEIILKQPASAHLPSWRPGEHIVTTRGPAGWWEDIDRAAVPPLAGYVEARARPGADVLLEVAATKHPVLATWRHGLGRVTTLLTEPTGPGTATWRDWNDYGTWLGRVLARTAAERRLPFRATARRDDDSVVLTVRSEDQRVVHLLVNLPGEDDQYMVSAKVQAEADGAWTPVPLRLRAPGLWTARVPAADAFRVWSARGELLVVPEDDVVPASQVDPLHGLDLARLAELTGGDALDVSRPSSLGLSVGGGDAPVGVVPLWPWCFLLVLLFFFADIAWRRRPSGGAA